MGASNLPPRAIIALDVQDSDRTFVTLPHSGSFEQSIRPKKGFSFHAGLVASAYFQIAYHKGPRQSPSVIQVVGPRGWNLAGVEDPAAHFTELSGLSHNPQLYQMSGWYYGIETKVILGECDILASQ